MTLLDETLSVLAIHGKTPDDVLWCGDGEFYTFDWETFNENANFEYDSGYGSQEVATDLKIVGDDWWLERNEYDGAENWIFRTMPIRDESIDMISGEIRLGLGQWETLEELNDDDYGDDDDDDWDEDYDDGDYE